MIYIIDTHSWVEYFKGDKKAEIMRDLLNDNKNKFVTLDCCISEFRCYCLRHNLNFDEMLTRIRINTVVLPVLLDQWIESAKIRHDLRKKIAHFGLIDAILVSKQKELKAKIISGDPHFKTLKNVIYIGN